MPRESGEGGPAHTSGPWTADADGQVWRKELRIADTCPRGIAHVAPRSERPANARLIAASPELLAALEELAGLMDDVRAGDYAPDSLTNQPARAAIAKARGV